MTAGAAGGASDFNAADLKQIRKRGKSVRLASEELRRLARGVPPAKLLRPCRVGDGIVALRDSALHIEAFEKEAAKGRACKFVTASGAASRMFEPQAEMAGVQWTRDILTARAKSGDAAAADALRLMENLHRFAFHQELASRLSAEGRVLEQLLREGRFGEVLLCLVGEEGLRYANLPKGLIPFHRYPDGPRTAFEEHVAESRAYLKDRLGGIRIHFTVSPGWVEPIRVHLETAARRFQTEGTDFRITQSVQSASTDTLAVDTAGHPFRDPNGRLVFRPAGHGALLANLNGLRGDLVFVRTIDNVLPDRLKPTVVHYKKALAGLLVSLQRKVHGLAERLSAPGARQASLRDAEELLATVFFEPPSPAAAAESSEARRRRLFHRLDRPLRVCGIVRHNGEPGGMPFWVEDEEGRASLQIVERSQVDPRSPAQETIFTSNQFFNPADLVCGMRNHRGEPFDLTRFADPNACFIARKKLDGRELKVLELPGLWNGAMAHWNTVFVEIPRETFHPVKNVLDLLEERHRV